MLLCKRAYATQQALMLLYISALSPCKRSPPLILNWRAIAHALTHSRARGDQMEKSIWEGQQREAQAWKPYT